MMPRPCMHASASNICTANQRTISTQGAPGADLSAVVKLRITDDASCNPSPCSGPYAVAATGDDLDLSVPVDCEPAPGSGSTCEANTTANAVVGAGAFSAGNMTVIEAFRVRLVDSANALFEQQGYLVP